MSTHADDRQFGSEGRLYCMSTCGTAAIVLLSHDPKSPSSRRGLGLCVQRRLILPYHSWYNQLKRAGSVLGFIYL